jgi:FixJ family two-component response regulator
MPGDPKECREDAERRSICGSDTSHTPQPSDSRARLQPLLSERHLATASEKYLATTLVPNVDGEKAPDESVVFVVEDNEAERTNLKQLLNSVGLSVLLFESASDFLESTLPNKPCCMVLDMGMPAMTGLQLQEELVKARVELPIVFVTRHGNMALAVRAMKAGAVDFLSKPFNGDDLLEAVFVALKRDRKRRAHVTSLASLRERFKLLSSREREVLFRVADGLLNKQIAADLSVSEVMVKVHRAKGMRKLNADSVAALVRMIDALLHDELGQQNPGSTGPLVAARLK